MQESPTRSGAQAEAEVKESAASNPAPTSGKPVPKAAVTAKQAETPSSPSSDPKLPGAIDSMQGTPTAERIPRADKRVERDGDAESAKIQEYFAWRRRIPLQVFEDESRAKKWSYLGPTLTSIASIILTVFVWISASWLTNKQIELQTTQVKAELADMRVKFLSDLTSTDEAKNIPAEIGLAGHGRDAMPIVHFALGVEQGHIRKSAVRVFYRMFQAANSFEERKQLLDELTVKITSPNQILHTGIVQGLVKVAPLLNSEERQRVIVFLQENVPPNTVCKQTEGRTTVREAATFFWANDANSIPYLLEIARNPKCGDGWLQAIVKLEDVVAKQPQSRAELLNRIWQTRKEVLSTLRQEISDEELASGGFEGFTKEGQVEIRFEDFKAKIEEDFNRLTKSLESSKR